MEIGQKYIVIKREDIEQALTGSESLIFRDLVSIIQLHRDMLGKKENRYLVIHQDEHQCAEMLAKWLHETYEELAPVYKYKTRKETAITWEDIADDNPNKQLMIAVCRKLLASGFMGEIK